MTTEYDEIVSKYPHLGAYIKLMNTESFCQKLIVAAYACGTLDTQEKEIAALEEKLKRMEGR